LSHGVICWTVSPEIVFVPSTSECNLIGKYGHWGCNELKWGYTTVGGWALTQWCPYKKMVMKTQRHTGRVPNDTELSSYKPGKFKDCQHTPEAAKMQPRIPSGFRSMALPIPWFKTYSLQNLETVHFCFLGHRHLWYFIEAARKYTRQSEMDRRIETKAYKL
jgi:hypothetical protein